MSSSTHPALLSLRRQHHSLHPPFLLHLPSPADLVRTDSQTYLVDHILNDPVIRDVVPERSYRRSFWRRIVKSLEIGEYEVDARIYEALADLMISSPSSGPSDMPKPSYRTFLYDMPEWTWRCGQGERRVTLLEEQVAIQAATTGLRTWTASLRLAHHILRDPSILSRPSTCPRDTHVLPPVVELGAGTGFLSILLSQLGADVISSDLDADPDENDRLKPLARLSSNLELNELENPPRVVPLDWTDVLRPVVDRSQGWQDITRGKPRTIVAADVIYDPDLITPLVKTISALFEGSPDGVAIIAATVRNPMTIKMFETSCDAHADLLGLSA
ncbi:MAG: hypothetical protein TREMPRED_004185 [Tremellales sp. Tagirdzhanova-0007]|nr:MAG: hypothetical protein TREMPRED_004185 [Tremellales sp. Tagirdzhanova-0007]